MTSEPRAPAPDPTSRLQLRRGRRHVRPPGAGARSRGAAPGASCPFLGPLPGLVLDPRGGHSFSAEHRPLALGGKSQNVEGGRANTALARPPTSAWLRGARPQRPWCVGLGQPPRWGGRAPRPPDRHPFPFKLGQENRPAWGSCLCPCPSEYGAVRMVIDLFTNSPEPQFPKLFQFFDSHREPFCSIFAHPPFFPFLPLPCV